MVVLTPWPSIVKGHSCFGLTRKDCDILILVAYAKGEGLKRVGPRCFGMDRETRSRAAGSALAANPVARKRAHVMPRAIHGFAC